MDALARECDGWASTKLKENFIVNDKSLSHEMWSMKRRWTRDKADVFRELKSMKMLINWNVKYQFEWDWILMAQVLRDINGDGLPANMAD